jgi:hypothetical protein
MSTRSLIVKENPDGTVTGIYCHSDGMPHYNGVILARYYTDPAKIDALLALGNLSILGPELDARDSRDERGGTVATLNAAGCSAYGRDWGRTGEEAMTAPLGQLTKWYCDTEYVYLWAGGKWWCHAITNNDMGYLGPVIDMAVEEKRYGPLTPGFYPDLLEPAS